MTEYTLWKSTDVCMPRPNKMVMFNGGCGYWSGYSWVQVLSHRQFKLDDIVDQWAHIPTSADPDFKSGMDELISIGNKTNELLSKLVSK